MFPKQAELANVVEEIKKNILIINGLIMKVRIKNPICGVPISFINKYCPNQFRIVKFRKGDDGKDLSVNGKCPYFRILIQKIK